MNFISKIFKKKPPLECIVGEHDFIIYKESNDRNKGGLRVYEDNIWRCKNCKREKLVFDSTVDNEVASIIIKK